MKILLAPDPASPHGDDVFCRELARRAPARGHEAAVASIPASPGDGGAARLAAAGFAREADAVLSNGFQAASLLAARAAGKKSAVRLIDSFAEAPDGEFPAIRELLPQADRLLVPSRHLARLVKSWDANARVSFVPYAYDRVRAHQIALVTMRASRLADFQIVVVSRFDATCRQGLETLLAAAGRLRFDWHLTLVGTGPIAPSLQDRARQILPADRVLFTGALPHLKIMEFFRTANVYVEPAAADGFPAMSLYALAEGSPVVAPRAGAVTELIADGANGLLFNPGDATSLSEALVTLRSVRGLSLQLISEGVKTAERHTWDATITAALDALEEMLR